MNDPKFRCGGEEGTVVVGAEQRQGRGCFRDRNSRGRVLRLDDCTETMHVYLDTAQIKTTKV